MKIKSTVIILLLTIGITPTFAQSMDDYLEVARGVLQTEKKAAVAEVMVLSETETAPFWELYNEYNAEQYKIYSKRVEIIKDFAENYEEMTDEKADELWMKSMQFNSELLSLNKSYYKKFKKIIPAGKAAMYFQLENKIAALINAELAIEIPLLETNE